MATEERRNPVNRSIKTDELEKILQDHLHRLAAGRHINHAVAAVESMDGSLKWSGAEGLAGPDGTPMTPETPFWIASIKNFGTQ